MRVVLVVALSIVMPTLALAEVTVCHGATNCQTVSPGGARQWSEDEAVAKFMRDAQGKIYDAQQACRFADDPEACREAAQTFIQALRRTR